MGHPVYCSSNTLIVYQEGKRNKITSVKIE